VSIAIYLRVAGFSARGASTMAPHPSAIHDRLQKKKKSQVNNVALGSSAKSSSTLSAFSASFLCTYARSS